MKLWTTISPTSEEKRWRLLSEHLKRSGIENEFVPWEGPVTPPEDLTLLDKYHHVRFSNRFAAEILKTVKVRSSWVALLGVVDGMVKKDEAWWPLCALYESFGKLLLDLGHDLDTRGSVLVAGTGGSARAAIAAFFKAGFRQFLLTHLEKEEAEQAIRDVETRFFGLKIQFVPKESIVLLPGESSVLVNCTSDATENSLLIELSYMNFLKRPGFLFDVNRNIKPSILVQEAHDADVKVIEGFQIAAQADYFWAKWAFGAELDLKAYVEDFKTIL